MNKHLLYSKYLFRHKWFVFQAGRKLGVNWFQLLIHDWSKFLPSEWFPYANYFYGNYPSEMEHTENDFGQKHFIHPEKKTKEYWERRFNIAWLHHQKRNKHHWQYWVLMNDDGTIQAMEIPDKYLNEMIADWCGAGRAITGKWEVKNWWDNNHSKMTLEINTKEELLLRFIFGDEYGKL